MRLCPVVLATALAAALARAQEQVVLHEVDGQKVCSIKVTPFGGAARLGGLGFVLVDAQNHDSRPHALRVEIQSWNRSTQDINLQRSLMLGPEERGRFFLPLPNSGRGGFGLHAQVDARTYVQALHLAPTRGLTALLVSDRPQVTPQALAIAQAASPFATSDKPAVVSCNTIDLPPDWRCFTGFDLVIVDGRSRLGAEGQEALRRFAFAGGLVLVGSPRSLPAGSLHDRCEGSELPALQRHGLGVVFALGTLEPDGEVLRELIDYQPGRGVWPAPEALLVPQVVPGLDDAPVIVFLCVILLFTALAGPVNFVLLRRWKRPLLALVTVPVLGFGTTLLMLGYAAVHDGFGVRGVVRTWTLLDQKDHEALTIGARTLFAGLSPDALQIDSDALVLAPSAFLRLDNRRPDRWHFDGNTNELDGGVLPSRTTSVLVDARQGLARERLRVRMQPDGALELLTDGGVVPIGTVVLRDPDGTYWTGEAPLLRSCTAAVAQNALAALVREASWIRAAAAELAFPDMRGRHEERDVDLSGLTNRFMQGSLAPGGWCARVAAAPWAGEHGLTVDYDVRQHWVFGRLAAEDFLR